MTETVEQRIERLERLVLELQSQILALSQRTAGQILIGASYSPQPVTMPHNPIYPPYVTCGTTTRTITRKFAPNQC